MAKRASKLIEDARRGNSVVGMLSYYIGTSQIAAAIEAYREAVEQREPVAAQGVAGALLTPLRADPRWRDLMRMMNLPKP